MLRSLSAPELHDQLCGEEALEWPLEHLQEAVIPGAGYTRNSQVHRSERTRCFLLVFLLSSYTVPVIRTRAVASSTERVVMDKDY